MKKILTQLFEYQKLSFSEARQVLFDIAAGQYNHAQISAFLSAYMMRPITVAELQGFRAALLELCRPVDLSDFETIDLCGTGGDGKNTFNVSTLTAFVLAGAGYKVAKHGNYGVSSVCGSSNVMEYLGYTFSNKQDRLYQQLDKNNLTFLHAPLFHPAMKAVAPVRRELGMKTFFNMLGPLVNPARPQNQLVGVFNLELARLYKYILQEGKQAYTIVHSLDGYDEISLTSAFRSITRETDRLIEPRELGLAKLAPKDLFGGDTIEAAAQIFIQILDGKGTLAQQNVVAANAALAMQMLDGTTLEDGVARAKETLASGKARQTLTQLIANSK
ncbi:MAG TPA: anthranilate phosphoribosyltransferase [Bacteroidetes bacterium]|nr:anthranilate phosphoribosyltransferase [Bacteroidota bacterium]